MKKSLLTVTLTAALGAVLLAGLVSPEIRAEMNAEAKDKPATNASETSTAKGDKTNTGNATIEALKQKLTRIFRSEPEQIKESEIPGLYQIMYGTEIVYVSADGNYFLAGDLLNLNTRENLTELAKRDVRLKLLARQDNKPLVFKADNEKHKLTVYTDIDCPYCAKLHREVPELNKKGITVEYLMFPRAGIGSPSFEKAVNVWCADDQQKAMTDAKERRPVENKTCDNPIKDQYLLGQELGVTGTPALITATGRLIPGYVPAERLSAMLEAEKAEAETETE